MPSVEVKIWLALKSRIESLVLPANDVYYSPILISQPVVSGEPVMGNTLSVSSGEWGAKYAIAWPGDPFNPPHEGGSLQPYLRIGRITVAPIRRYIDSGQPHERTGALIVTLVHPMNQPVVATYDQYAGLIAEHFKDGTCMEHSGIAVSIPSYPHVLDGYEDDGYWTAPVRIPWRCFA